MTDVQLTISSVGPEKVMVNGHDVSGEIDGIELVAMRGEATRVFLITRGASLAASVDGIVEAGQAGGVTADAVRALDPKAIGQEVLDRQGWGTDPGEVWLAVVAEHLERGSA